MNKNFIFIGIKDSLFARNKLNNLFTSTFAFENNLPKLQSDKYRDVSSTKERLFPSV